jgi:dienelactone hydrolase
MATGARAVLLAAFAGVVAAVVAPSALAFPKLGQGCARADYRSGGHAVPAELCRPSGAERAAPAVLVLYGCGRFGSLDSSLAHELPRAGIATLYVDYFAQTPPPAGGRGYCGGGGEAGTVWTTWQREVRDGAAALRRTSGIDSHRVGVVGWSLGGGVALDAAASAPVAGHGARPFDAMVIYSSYDDGPALAEARRLPPTMVLSAGTTDAVPVSGAIALHRALAAARVPTELHIWPHGRHSWPGAQGVQGLAWTTRFLHHYLGG